MDEVYASISEIRDRLDRREVSSRELTLAALERITHLNKQINSFVTVTEEEALHQADMADRMVREGTAGPLTGIPMAVKDILSTAGVRTTCGSRILAAYVPPFTATTVLRLFERGAVMAGKTNMDEFAMGSSNENSAFGPVRNPWDLTRVPGGSSGGSAAAVASGGVVYALGTDTGGSIRQPASLTNTVGLKPTYGRVSRYGLVAFASSLDQAGPITRTVKDAALVLGAIAGHDPLDSTSLDAPVPDYAAALTGDVEGLRIGIPREYFEEGIDPGVRAAIDDALTVYRRLGATTHDVSLPYTKYALSTYYIISPAEAMANLARYDGVRYGLSVPGADIWEMFARTRECGFGSEVKRRILLGTYALSAGYYDAYYLKAQRVRTLVRRDFEEAFSQVDVLVTPTSPTTAFEIGARVDDPLQMYLSDVYTVPINIAGICGISVPAGFSAGLPIGMQILGKPLDEPAILNTAYAFEQATDFYLQRPRLSLEAVS